MTHPVSIRIFNPKRDYAAFRQLNFQTFWESIPPEEGFLFADFQKHYAFLLDRYAPHNPDRGFVTIAAIPGVPYVGHCWLGVQNEFFTHKPLAWIFDVTIRDGFRGRGIGRVLLHDMMARCKEKGFEQIGLQVMTHNTRAIEFYRREGFAPTSTTYTRNL